MSEAVVVTGASSGIGRATALRLAGAGYHVFAGVRKEPDGDALVGAANGTLTPLILEVTAEADVQAAAARVGESGLPLAGLVNNAGIGTAWPMEAIPLDELRWQFEVNVFGQLAMIQEFLPSLRRSRGRIINIGTVGDRLTIPFGAPLTSSKWALASITEALRMELRADGIQVVLIEPATIRTTASHKVQEQAERALALMGDEHRARYEKSLRSMVAKAHSSEQAGSDPDVVARVVQRALTSARPSTRYLAGKDSRKLAFMARWLPDRAFDTVRAKLFGLPTKAQPPA
ncbi:MULTISPECIES: SDR family oxidoreductase [Actinomadura]|uniref:SDR family oxidoreductase n=1 Tax=Actinomadura geliboluensis TaxID=882440 RepID=A0A5S4HAX6_9ACTN|nr:SDR family oxidoreductase [Actinomadura geliboluensis]TMR42383.1 SDR family oxidoreductase [Actinomadura geliboluensis]